MASIDLTASDAVDKLVEAGRIARKALEEGIKLVEPGITASKVCEFVESYIVELGGLPAFPCNISIDDVAAHYTPGVGDDVEIHEDAVVKLDVGVHVDGYIADTAMTKDLSGRNERLLEASREALESVVRRIRVGMSLYELGKIIQSEIAKRGYRPIRNLYGHSIGRYTIHSGLNIPNYPDRLMVMKRLRPGMLVAVEPFATDGKGSVRDGPAVNIYAYTGRTPRTSLNESEARVLKFIKSNYRTLPFTPRWLAGKLGLSGNELVMIIKSLASKGVLHGYPVLVEAGKGLVAQFEHTFLITSDEIVVTTLQ